MLAQWINWKKSRNASKFKFVRMVRWLNERPSPAFCPSSLLKKCKYSRTYYLQSESDLVLFLIHIPALMMVDFLLVSCGPFLPATKRPTHFRPFCLIFPQIRVLSDNTLSQIHFTLLLITHFINCLGFLQGMCCEQFICFNFLHMDAAIANQPIIGQKLRIFLPA